MTTSKRTLRTIIDTVCIVLLFCAVTVPAIPLLVVGAIAAVLVRGTRRFFRTCLWVFGFVFLHLLSPWIPVRTKNPDMALHTPHSILVCNHQSFLDLYLFAAQSERNLCFVTKHWPFRLLFFLHRPCMPLGI